MIVIGGNVRVRKSLAAVMAAVLLLASGAGEALAQKKPPYWASISAGKARTRTGPGRQFPAMWLYQRPQLPVKVIETFPNWRKVQDPDGATGWMQANLLSDARTAIVRGEIRPMRAEPDVSASVSWRAEPGVVGTITDCADGWCRFEVAGKAGYIETSHIWGAEELGGE
ncbi:SH3 domain-containing protein [Sphingomonas cavernae]|uniref:SH3-like domain-containing protein n=1 Tax=Sphingomonas cavernae TaxID=2320861 RepID=A0A418W5R2_9SPHN|nr:SH3 domain-containing protein [Sphingomonas cavernae]RJF85373.1 hypothetical protein D3876_15610 [Sphingomonas cavernae]